MACYLTGKDLGGTQTPLGAGNQITIQDFK